MHVFMSSQICGYAVNMTLKSVHTTLRITLSFLYTIVWLLGALPFLLHLYVMFEYALCMCLLVLLSSLSLSGIIPPLPQVLQGTTMQQLQQVQVAQSQATPITVNTSNPSKWLLFFPQKSLFGVQRSFF